MTNLIQTRFFVCLLLVLCVASCTTVTPAPAGKTPYADIDNPEQWSGRTREVLMNALSLTGVKYAYGGNTPEIGFDCSGFVGYVFKQAASLTLPHSAQAMSLLGKSIPKNELQPGDLVFFNTVKTAISHVGIYMGNNRFIHAPSAGGNVRVENMKEGYWATRYSGAQRLENTSDSGQVNNE